MKTIILSFFFALFFHDLLSTEIYNLSISFFFTVPATTEIYTLSLHDALPITVPAGGRRSTTLTWDTRDAKGIVVPPDAYTLVIEVRSDDGVSRVVTASA